MAQRSRAIDRRRGLTLMEVVAGLVLLATLIVSLFTALQTHQKQLRRSTERREAVEVADRLIAEWYTGPAQVPRQASGATDGPSIHWLWRTVPRRRDVWSTDVLAETVRLQLFRPGSSDVVLEVDLLIPVEVSETVSSSATAVPR